MEQPLDLRKNRISRKINYTDLKEELLKRKRGLDSHQQKPSLVKIIHEKESDLVTQQMSVDELSSNSTREEIKKIEEQILEEFKRIQEMADKWKNIANTKEQKKSTTYPVLKKYLISGITDKTFTLKEKGVVNQEENIKEKTSTENRYPLLKNMLKEKTSTEENPLLKKMLIAENPNTKMEEKGSSTEKENHHILKKRLLVNSYPNTVFEHSTTLKEQDEDATPKRLAEKEETDPEKNENTLSEKDDENKMNSDNKLVFENIENVINESIVNPETTERVAKQEWQQNPDTTENIEENMEEDEKNEQVCSGNQVSSKINHQKKCTKKISKRKVNFGYIAIEQNMNGKIHKFTLSTFTETVTVKNCENCFFEKLEFYMIKFDLSTVYILKEDYAKLKKNKPYLKQFKLKKKALKCKKCKKSSCTVGRVAYYFENFHRINFNECEFRL